MAKQRPLQYEPWNGEVPSPLGGFPGLINAEAYAAIHRFLVTEQLVRTALDQVAAANQHASRDRFHDWMKTQEIRSGFSPEIVTIAARTLVKASLFWLWIFNRRPLNDLGVDDIHGVSTHRLQWVLIGLWNDATGALGGPRMVSDLYAGLAHANARHFRAEWAARLERNDPTAIINTARENPWRSVWDALFDGPFVANATSPEYLCGNFLATQYPALNALVRA